MCVSSAVFISSSHLSQHVTERIISYSMVQSARILLLIFCCEGSVFEVEVMSHCIYIILSISGILFLEALCVEQPPDEPLAVQNMPECTDWSKVNNVQHFQSVQTSLAAHTTSYLMKPIIELHLVQSWEWLEIFIYSSLHLHGTDSKSFYGA